MRISRRSCRFRCGAPPLLAVWLLLTAPAAASAHAQFFVDGRDHPGAAPVAWSVIALMVATALLASIVARALERELLAMPVLGAALGAVSRALRVLSPVARFAPVIARVSLGTTLLLAPLTGSVIQPGVHVGGHLGAVLPGVQAGIGIAMILGVALTASAVAFAVLLAVAAAATTPLLAVERIDMVAVAAFAAMLGPRPFGPRLDARQLVTVARASLVLRCGLGFVLFALAIDEKLRHPGMTTILLDHYPAADASLLLPISQFGFVVDAAFVEMLFGALLLLLPIAELTVLVVAIPFIATIAIFGPMEIVGHLPIYGAAISLLALATHPQARAAVATLGGLERLAVAATALEPERLFPQVDHGGKATLGPYQSVLATLVDHPQAGWAEPSREFCLLHGQPWSDGSGTYSHITR